MSVLATATMAGICSFVWGGFLVLLVRAVRMESAKAEERLDEHPPHPSP